MTASAIATPGSRNEIAARTARDGAALDIAMGDLGRALRKQLSIGDLVAEHPLPWLTGAFAFGVWMGIR